MAAADLHDISERLYALPPEDFTAARDAEAKGVDDKQLRAAVKALRRPTVPAWLVNRLAAEQPDLLDQLLDLGPALAAAQQEGRGEALRELGQQRRELVGAVAGTAVELGGRPVTAQVRLEVEQTLEAALADADSAEAVRSGRLVRALAYAGFGGVDLDGAVAVASPRRPARAPRKAPAKAPAKEEADGPGRPDSAADAAAVAAAEAAALDAAATLDDAVRACEDAERERAEADGAAGAATQEAEAAAADVARLEQELAAARERSTRAREGAEAADRRAESAAAATTSARAAVSAAQEAAEVARSALDRLRRS